jgi:hypothetical protein
LGGESVLSSGITSAAQTTSGQNPVLDDRGDDFVRYFVHRHSRGPALVSARKPLMAAYSSTIERKTLFLVVAWRKPANRI